MQSAPKRERVEADAKDAVKSAREHCIAMGEERTVHLIPIEIVAADRQPWRAVVSGVGPIVASVLPFEEGQFFKIFAGHGSAPTVDPISDLPNYKEWTTSALKSHREELLEKLATAKLEERKLLLEKLVIVEDLLRPVWAQEQEGQEIDDEGFTEKLITACTKE